MIGTTFKLGFDGTSVSRGLGRIAGTLGKGLGRIGVGALERVGHRMTDLMGRIVMAVPDAIKETADWAGGLTDMATATGVSVQELILLEEKFRLAGVSAKESGYVMSRFAKNIKDAATEGGPAAEALRALGFWANEFKVTSVDKAFEQVAKRLAEMTELNLLDNPEGVMSDLFGGKLGYQQLKLFKDWENVTRQAENNVGKLASSLGSGLANQIDQWGDALGRFENFKRSLATIALDEGMRLFGGPGGPDKMFDALDPEKIRPKIREAMRTVEQMLQNPSQFFGDIFKSIGRSIGEGIKESISLPNLLPNFLKPQGGKPQASNDGITSELKKHTSLLSRLLNKDDISTFA